MEAAVDMAMAAIVHEARKLRQGGPAQEGLDILENDINGAFRNIKIALKEELNFPTIKNDAAFYEAQTNRLKDNIKALIEADIMRSTWVRVMEALERPHDPMTQALRASITTAVCSDPAVAYDPNNLTHLAQTHLQEAYVAERARQADTLEQHGMWKEIIKFLEPEQDEDLEIVARQGPDPFQFKCPITQSTYVEPMRNTVCGHSFSHAGIMQSLNKKTEIKCPVPGCNKPVKRSTLEKDKEKQLQLDRHARQTQGGGGTSTQRYPVAEEVDF